jgi:molybdopterin-guanine dinucleotide biosynthesis protein A
MANRISGVILAGGSNKRFGGITKANVVIDGETIISRIISTISDLFVKIIIVTNMPEEFQEFIQYKIVEDQYLKAGPLGGIHAALKASSEDAIFVFAGDMPFLDKEIISDQINEFSKEQHEVLIPEVDQFIEPLHAIYRKSVLNHLERFLSEGKSRAVRDFLREVNVGYLQMPKTEGTKIAFANINSPSDLAKINLKSSRVLNCLNRIYIKETYDKE